MQAEKVSAVVGGVQLSITGGGRACQKREVTESRTETRATPELAVTDEAETRQTSTGRPLRECREKVGFNYVLGKIVEMLKGEG